LTEDVDVMWDRMAQCICRSAREVLGISKGGEGSKSGAWWWNEELREKVKEKQRAYAALNICATEEEKQVREVVYKDAKKLAKKRLL